MAMITKTQQSHIHWQKKKCSKWACKHRGSVIYHSESMFWFQSHFGVKMRGETEVGRPDERDRVNWLARVLCFTTLHHRQISVTEYSVQKPDGLNTSADSDWSAAGRAERGQQEWPVTLAMGPIWSVFLIWIVPLSTSQQVYRNRRERVWRDDYEQLISFN